MARLSKAQIAENERVAKKKKRQMFAGVALAGLTVIGVAVAIIQLLFGTAISDTLTKPSASEAATQTLSNLKAGNTLASVREALGEATLEDPIPGSEWRYSVFVREDFAVSTVTDADQQVVVLSILACDPDIKPQFTTGTGSVIQLNNRPIAEAESSPGSSSDDSTAASASRDILYLNTSTGRQSAQFLEFTADSPRSGNLYHLYALGFSGSCGEEFIPDLPESPPGLYSGTVEDAPAGVHDFRSQNAANVYTDIDTQFDFNFSVSEQGYGMFHSAEHLIDGVPLSMHGDETPDSFIQ